MAANKCYVNDIGTKILVNCKCDITGAIDTVFKVKKPDNTIVEWEAIIVGTNYLKYYTVAGDFIEGKYSLQVSLNIDGWTGLGETAKFKVHDPFK